MAIALVAHAAAGSTNAVNVTTSAIDTTGASFLCCWAAGDTPNPAITDSKSNRWEQLGPVAATHPNGCWVYFCASPTVGVGHTFSGGASAVSLTVAAFSGGALRISQGSAITGSTSTIQPGSISPTVGEALITVAANFVTGGTFSVDSGFTIVDQLTAVASQHYGAALAWVTAASTTALNPTWTFSGAAAQGATAYTIVLSPSPFKALKLVQATSASAVSSLAFPASVTAGNLLIVAAGCQGTVTSISDNRGNTWVQDAASTTGSNQLTVWHAIANSSGACTVTVMMTASFMTVAVQEFTGFTTIAVNNTAMVYNSVTPSTISVSNSAASCLLFAAIRGFHNLCDFTAINGGPIIITKVNNSDATATEYQNVGTASTWTLGFNILADGADNAPLIAVAYGIDGGGGGGTTGGVLGGEPGFRWFGR